MTDDIFSDHTAMRAALGESVDTIDALMREISAAGDGTGLDAETFDKLNLRQGMTAGEMEEAIATALLGRKAVDEFERIDEESARSVDSGGQTFSSGAGSGGAGGVAGGSGGAAPYGAGDPTGVMTNLSNDSGGASFMEKQALENQAQQAAQAQQSQAQQAQQIQQMRESAAWQQAMAEQQNRAMLNQLNIAAQQQAMVQAAELQERIAEQNAAAEAAIAEGGAAPTTASDVDLTSEDIQAIIGDLFEEGGYETEGGSLESGDYGRYEPAGLSGLSPDEVSFEKMADGQMSEAEVDEVIQAALDLNGVSEDPQVRERFTHLWRAMSLHESGHNANAANGWDSNAHGATQSDGFPYNSSRGPWQCIPTTFAANHIEGTSTSIYDPLASAAASINYTMERYGIDENGNGLEEFASVRGIDVNTGDSYGGYIGY